MRPERFKLENVKTHHYSLAMVFFAAVVAAGTASAAAYDPVEWAH